MNNQGVSSSQAKRGAVPGDIIPKGYRKTQLTNFTPEMMGLFKQLFGFTSPDSYTSRLAQGDEELFNQIEAPAFRQFQEMQGDLANRFSGMGMGARRGSGFANAANQQTSDFAMNLQAQRQGLQRQAIQDLMGMSNMLLGQRPYDQSLISKNQTQSGSSDFIKSALPAVISAGGAILGGMATGGPGAAPAGAAAYEASRNAINYLG